MRLGTCHDGLWDQFDLRCKHLLDSSRSAGTSKEIHKYVCTGPEHAIVQRAEFHAVRKSQCFRFPVLRAGHPEAHGPKKVVQYVHIYIYIDVRI